MSRSHLTVHSFSSNALNCRTMRVNDSFIARRLFPALLPVLLLVQSLLRHAGRSPPGTAKVPASPVLRGLSAPPAAAPAALGQGNDDPLGRSTPRGTVLGFIKAAGSDDYDTAVQYLDTRQHGELARKLARQLKEVLDRGASIDLVQAQSTSPREARPIPRSQSEGQIRLLIRRHRQASTSRLDRVEAGR